MHKKKKEHKKRGIGWTILRIFLGAAGILVLVLVVYIGYLFASYHRIEDNLELEVEKPAEGNVDETLKTGTEYSALNIISGLEPIRRISVSLWMEVNLPGQKVRKACWRR